MGEDSKPSALAQLLNIDELDERGERLLPVVHQEQAKAEQSGMCVECGDQPRVLFCEQCQDDYCEMCFEAQHRKGNRLKHTTKKLVSERSPENVAGEEKGQDDLPPLHEASDEDAMMDVSSHIAAGPSTTYVNREWMLERCKFIPMRLTLRERKIFRLVYNTLDVSEYTDKIDIISWHSKSKRIFAQIKEVCAILSGMVIACDYKEGQKLIKGKQYKDNEEFFQYAFEISRRHKIRNPEKMRDSYGKLLHMLMDSVVPDIQELLEFNCVTPIETVYSFLESRDALNILTEDLELLLAGTAEIDPEGKRRYQIDNELRAKDAAFDKFCQLHADPHNNLPLDALELAIRSICDNHSFLRSNREPCDRMIRYLTENFDPDTPRDDKHSLSIHFGQGGARLSHSHNRQYYYALQSMTLWREILHDFFKLWVLAEQDLLDGNNVYRLRNTGQGLNRVQDCPRIGRAMREIVYRVQKKVQWVGSSVIHLGDHNVPNAFTFIDKYTQVSRILMPITITLRRLPELLDVPTLAQFVKINWGTIENLKMAILTDFFRYGFDGSGSDNFFDSGSCIDGRLTSAWNWCSKLSKKPYYPVFLFTGFASFDGEF